MLTGVYGVVLVVARIIYYAYFLIDVWGVVGYLIIEGSLTVDRILRYEGDYRELTVKKVLRGHKGSRHV